MWLASRLGSRQLAAVAATSRDALRAVCRRGYASDLKEVMRELVPKEQARVKEIKAKFGDQKLGDATVAAAYGGMRGITGLVWETSLLDPEEGIRFRGKSIPELQRELPKAQGGSEPLPEALFWLLMTSNVPSQAQVEYLSQEMYKRSKLPPHVEAQLLSLPRDMHPMTQFSIGVLALLRDSTFAKAYAQGVHKSTYWEYVYEDTLSLISRLPTVAATIYRHTYQKGAIILPKEGLDLAANYAHMMGYDDAQVHELMRLYLTIHADHEGGNVSAHTANVVGSALSDPYLAFSAALNGLAGPLHGLANQEVLKWLKESREHLGDKVADKEQLAAFCRDTLASGKVIPGYGHAVLRKTDPRYTCQREFAKKHLPGDPLFKLVSDLYEVVPDILLATGKVKNPWPNVDAHSGVLLQHYGIKEENYYTVMFGVSRGIGIGAAGIWHRALGFPIERPKSTTSDFIEAKFAK